MPRMFRLNSQKKGKKIMKITAKNFEKYLENNDFEYEIKNGKITIAGWLNLRGCTGLERLPEGLTVGGSLNLSGTKKLTKAKAQNKIKTLPENYILSWQNGKYRLIDGILSEIVEKRGNVFKVRIAGEKAISYIIKDGDIYSHGKTIKEARESLLYKISDRDKSKYKNFTFNTKMSMREAIGMYRIITGACEAGTRHFVENVLTDKKESYTVKEVLDLTKGQYGNKVLREFFNERAAICG